jgi:hypothetical protein
MRDASLVKFIPSSRRIAKRRLAMFAIEWLHDGAVVDRDLSMSESLGEVMKSAESRAVSLSIRLRERAPDSFRLKNDSDNVIGIYCVAMNAISKNSVELHDRQVSMSA